MNTADLLREQCRHGANRRTECDRCEMADRIATLERELATEEQRAAGYLAERDEAIEGLQSLKAERAEMVGLLREVGEARGENDGSDDLIRRCAEAAARIDAEAKR